MIIEYNNEEMDEMIKDSYEYYMGLIELIELNGVIKNEVLGRIIEESINGQNIVKVMVFVAFVILIGIIVVVVRDKDLY